MTRPRHPISKNFLTDNELQQIVTNYYTGMGMIKPEPISNAQDLRRVPRYEEDLKDIPAFTKRSIPIPGMTGKVITHGELQPPVQMAEQNDPKSFSPDPLKMLSERIRINDDRLDAIEARCKRMNGAAYLLEKRVMSLEHPPQPPMHLIKAAPCPTPWLEIVMAAVIASCLTVVGLHFVGVVYDLYLFIRAVIDGVL